MNLTKAAKKRLAHLLPQDAKGFAVLGYLGTCRGSTPILNPSNGPSDEQEIMESAGISFFVEKDIAAEFRDCEMDYDPSLFGKGLTATWTHHEGCACNHG